MNIGDILVLLLERLVIALPFGLLGKKRLIGYWISFICFFFFGIGIGLLVSLCSPKKDTPNINIEKILHRWTTIGIVLIAMGILSIPFCVFFAMAIPVPTADGGRTTLVILAVIGIAFPIIGIILLVRSKKLRKRLSEHPAEIINQ